MRFIASVSAALAALAVTVAAVPTRQHTSTVGDALAVATTTLKTAPTFGAKKLHGLPPLPSNLSPGIHHFSHDAFGQPNITRVGELDTADHEDDDDSEGNGLVKRVNTWTGCEDYGFTPEQTADIPNAWNSLYNWAASTGSGGYSPWIHGHYFAFTSSGTFAYLCQWGSGNHAGTNEITQAHAVVSSVCAGPGMYQWNEWKKGLGVAARDMDWCNGESY